jgi:hypothetical protein
MICIIFFIILSTSTVLTAHVNGTNVDSLLIRPFCSKLGVTSRIGCCRVDKAVWFFGYSAVAFILGCMVLPILFCICGFRREGIRADSMGARYQAVHGTPRPFSCLQSLSMTGRLALFIPLLGMILAAVKVFFWDKQCTS